MLRLLLYPLTALLLALGCVELAAAVKGTAANLSAYTFVAMGVALYLLLSAIRGLNKNLEWLRTFSHELTHTVVGMMFFRKIHSFQAGVSSGVMKHSGGLRFGDTLISLAPYCLPIFTYLLLFLRELSAESSLYIFDMLVGITAAFHIGCFRRQTGSYQSDIRGVGVVFSYLFIVTMWVVNLAIALLSIRIGVIEAFKDFAVDGWNTLCSWYTLAAQIIGDTFAR